LLIAHAAAQEEAETRREKCHCKPIIPVCYATGLLDSISERQGKEMQKTQFHQQVGNMTVVHT